MQAARGLALALSQLHRMQTASETGGGARVALHARYLKLPVNLCTFQDKSFGLQRSLQPPCWAHAHSHPSTCPAS